MQFTWLLFSPLHICWCRWKLKSVQGKWLQSYLSPKLPRVFTERGGLWSRYLHKYTSQVWVGVSLRQNFPMKTWSALKCQVFGITGRSGTVWRFVVGGLTSSRLRTSPSVSTTLFWSGCPLLSRLLLRIRLSLCVSYGLDCCWLLDVLWGTRDYWCYYLIWPGNRFKTGCRLANHRYTVQFGHTTFRAAVHLYSFINLFRPLNKINGDFTYLFVLYESRQLLFL